MEKLSLGIFYAILAGVAATSQNVFSARLGEKLGMWETTFVVHIVGLVFSIIMVTVLGSWDLKAITTVNKLYLTAGLLGVLIVYTIGSSVGILGASIGTISMVITQITFSAIIDNYGLFGVDKIPFSFTKLIGIAIMVAGVVVFNFKG